MLVDSHCHLAFPEFKGRSAEMIGRMRAAGVERALCICTTMDEFPDVHALALQHPELWCTVGVHPDSADVHEPTVDELLAHAALPRVIGIGETGLDYYRLEGRSIADMAWQRDRFARHIAAARQAGLPLVVHTRAASADTLAVLRTEGQGGASGLPDARGVFHCFTETMETARAALDLGFFISFSGIVTFRNAEALRDVARFVPLDRMLVETDSPYLAPVPHRGKTNEPAFVAHVAGAVAELKGVDLATLARATTANFDALFGSPA
jgi:TatD DNase family protein